MYVDDVLAGSHELEDALKRHDELVQVLSSAGFVLRKWTVNHLRLLEDLPRENLLDADFLKFSDASTTKTLGLRWNAEKDSFYFKLVPQPRRDLVIKRAVLSEIAKLFDPAGWLSPKIIVAKIIMQQIWKDKTDWDESLKPLNLIQWRSFLDDYPNVEKINIPRWVNFLPENEVELHAFCDTFVIYARNVSTSEIFTHLLVLKTKVAPVKSETLPRLELCGAALMANMVESLCSQINLDKRKIYMWTDSTIILSWLNKPPCHWLTFVKNYQIEPPFDIHERFSDLPRAMRLISYCFRCLQYFITRKCLYNTLDLSQSDVKFTRYSLKLVCQRTFIPKYDRSNVQLVWSAGLSYAERYPCRTRYKGRFGRSENSFWHFYPPDSEACSLT